MQTQTQMEKTRAREKREKRVVPKRKKDSAHENIDETNLSASTQPTSGKSNSYPPWMSTARRSRAIADPAAMPSAQLAAYSAFSSQRLAAVVTVKPRWPRVRHDLLAGLR